MTKREAAAYLGVAEKTVERMVRRKELTQRTRKRPGMSPAAIYDPAELARAKAALDQSQTVGEHLSGQVAVVHHGVPQALVRVSQGEAFQTLLGRVADALDPHRPTVPIQDRVYLSVREAAAYTGLPEARIRELIKSANGKKLRTVPYRGGVKIRREDLLKVV